MSESVDLAELRKLEQAATPGPWFSHGSGEWDGAWIHAAPGSLVVADFNPETGCVQPFENAALIAATRNALPALLDRLERLEAVAEAARRHAAGHDIGELRAALAQLDAEKGVKDE